MLYEDLLFQWIDWEKLYIRNSTYDNCLYTIKNRVLPKFGKTDVKDITKNEIQLYVVELSNQYKRETVINVTKILSQSFKYLVCKKKW